MARGYTRTSLKKAFNQAQGIKRHDLIFKPHRKKGKEENVSRIIMNYSNEHVKIRKIIDKHWSILTDDPVLKKFVTL